MLHEPDLIICFPSKSASSEFPNTICCMSASVIALEEIPIISKMKSKMTQMVLKIPNHPKNKPPVSKDKQCKKLSKRLTMTIIVFLLITQISMFLSGKFKTH